MTAPYVLIIEDDPELRVIFADILTDANYRVATARHGEDAVQQLCAPGEAPDLILLDLAMPRMNGFEFRRIQKQYLRWASIPVVVVTGFATPEMLSGLGVAAALAKPVLPEALLEVVERCRRRAEPANP